MLAKVDEGLSFVKEKVDQFIGSVKTSVNEQAQSIVDLKKSNHKVVVEVDSKGLRTSVHTPRKTQHTIKWKSKGH